MLREWGASGVGTQEHGATHKERGPHLCLADSHVEQPLLDSQFGMHPPADLTQTRFRLVTWNSCNVRLYHPCVAAKKKTPCFRVFIRTVGLHIHNYKPRTLLAAWK